MIQDYPKNLNEGNSLSRSKCYKVPLKKVLQSYIVSKV